MAKKKSEEAEAPAAEPVSDTNGNGQAPRKVVQRFSAQSGKDTHIVVEVIENEFSTQAGEKVTYLCAVCSRTYVKQDGQVGTSYSYRQYDIPVLMHLLHLAHGLILDQRVAVDF